MFAIRLWLLVSTLTIPEPREHAAVIVEFQARPRAYGGSAAEGRAALARFRSDLGTIDGRMGKAAADAIRHEYRIALVGAAVTLPRETIAALQRLPYVRAVHVDVEVRACASDTPIVDAGTRINSRALPTRGEGITVAVIDSGIDYTHPALGGGFGPGFKVAGGYDFVNRDGDPIDDEGHGTIVAGVIAADSPDLAGVAPGATLFAYKVLSARGSGTMSDVIAGIERAADPNGDGDPSDHLDVINLSLGGRGSPDDLAARVTDAVSAAGVIVVAGAGNDHQVGTIISPAAARTAIAVGAIDSTGAVAAFSSRGPAAKVLSSKPDVMAPGVDIVTTKLGGGMTSASGTSLASPHVAGLAALLKKLHPDWTPADVKNALMSTALPTAGTPFVRGAGHVDGVRSAAASVFLSESALSFGLNPMTAGTFEATQTITATNRSSVTHTFDATVAVPMAATLTVDPMRLELAPGQSREIRVRLTIDNAAFPFPDDLITGGDIALSGETVLTIPWALLRAARATFTYDDASEIAVYPRAKTHFRYPRSYAEGAAEMYVVPGVAWDCFLSSYDDPSDSAGGVRVLAAKNVAILGDELVPFRREEAAIRVDLGARDRSGRPFSELPHVTGRRERDVLFRFASGVEPKRELTFAVSDVDRIFFSPAVEVGDLQVFDSYADLEEMSVYNVQYDPVLTLRESMTLQRSTSAHARLVWDPPAPRPFTFNACWRTGTIAGTSLAMRSHPCVSRPIEDRVVVDYYTTSETSVAVSGFAFGGGGVITPPLRGLDGAIVPAAERTPSPAEYRIANGQEITVADAPLFPFVRSYEQLVPSVAFTGPLADRRALATAGTWWTLHGADGAAIHSGSVSENATIPLPREAGQRLVAVREVVPLADHIGRGELEIRLGSDSADLVPPTFTSLRVLDGSGRPTSRVARNGAATLVFSAVDLAYDFSGRVLAMRRDAMRVAYRVQGTAEWRPLTVLAEGSETGSITELGHFPAGDGYRVDLSPVAGQDALIELRFELEDAAGNRLTWTQSPALAVGDVPPPKRRRAAGG